MLESGRYFHIGASALNFLPQNSLFPNQRSMSSLFPMSQKFTHLCCTEHLHFMQSLSLLPVTPVICSPQTCPELILTLQSFVCAYTTTNTGKCRKIFYCVWLLILNLSAAVRVVLSSCAHFCSLWVYFLFNRIAHHDDLWHPSHSHMLQFLLLQYIKSPFSHKEQVQFYLPQSWAVSLIFHPVIVIAFCNLLYCSHIITGYRALLRTTSKCLCHAFLNECNIPGLNHYWLVQIPHFAQQWHTGHQVGKISLDALDHLVGCMTFQWTGKCPVPNVSCCVVKPLPTGLWKARAMQHGTDCIGECSNSFLGHAIQGQMVW